MIRSYSVQRKIVQATSEPETVVAGEAEVPVLPSTGPTEVESAGARDAEKHDISKETV